jgi:TonB family protein
MRTLLVLVLLSTWSSLVLTQERPSLSDVQKFDAKTMRPVVTTHMPAVIAPYEAWRRHENGECIVTLTIDTQGMPQDVKIERCSDSIFADNSLATVKEYRFKPAEMLDGTVIAVRVTMDVTFTSYDGHTTSEPSGRISYAFLAPPGGTSLDPGPGPDGVYLLSYFLETPQMAKFNDKGFRLAANALHGHLACNVTLTLDRKGKPSKAEISKCDKPELEQPAVESLLRSKFKPAKLNGNAVPVRMTVQLLFDYFGPRSDDSQK